MISVFWAITVQQKGLTACEPYSSAHLLGAPIYAEPLMHSRVLSEGKLLIPMPYPLGIGFWCKDLVGARAHDTPEIFIVHHERRGRREVLCRISSIVANTTKRQPSNGCQEIHRPETNTWPRRAQPAHSYRRAPPTTTNVAKAGRRRHRCACMCSISQMSIKHSRPRGSTTQD